MEPEPAGSHAPRLQEASTPEPGASGGALPPQGTGIPDGPQGVAFLDWRAMIRGNWLGAGIVAVMTAATAGVLGLALALLAKPDDFGLANTLTLATIIATGAFGANLTGDLSGDGLLEFSGEGSIGLFPLTVTLASLTVAVLMFRRVTSAYGTTVAALGDAVRTAVLFGLCLWLPAMIFTSDNDEMGRGWGTDIDADSLGFEAEVGADPVGALFLGFFVLGVVLALYTLMRHSPAIEPTARREAESRLELVRSWVAAPLAGLAALALALPAAGVVGILVVGLFGEDNDIEVSGDETRLIVAVCVALVANGGVWILSLGSGAPFGFASADSESGDDEDWERLWGQITEDEPGLWISPLVLIVVLTVSALVVLRHSRSNAARDLVVWLATLVIAIPLLVRLSAFHLEGDVTEKKDEFWGNLYAGPEGFQTTVMILLIAAMVAFVAAMARGVVDPQMVRSRVAATARGLQQTPQSPVGGTEDSQTAQTHTSAPPGRHNAPPPSAGDGA